MFNSDWLQKQLPKCDWKLRLIFISLAQLQLSEFLKIKKGASVVNADWLQQELLSVCFKS